MRKLMLFLAVFSMSIGLATAQVSKISGKVSDSNGDPVYGAVVSVVGSVIATQTDATGLFTLNNVPRSAKKIRISYAGMNTQVLDIHPNMNVVMQLNVTDLDEAVVVAYGTAKKSTLTGATAVVKAEKIENRLTSDVSNTLSGAIAGVQTFSSNGQPGTGSTIRVRGVGSLNGSNAPLYVVDGVPFSGDLSSINPQDIDNLSVQKDAAATALYGARGANGVIMITTKKGKSGDAKITFDARLGVNSRMYKNYDVITNPATYMEKVYQARYNQGYYDLGYDAATANAYANSMLVSSIGYPIYTVPTGELLVGMNGRINPNATLGYSDGTYFYKPDNWEDETFSNNLRQEYNLTVSGGTDKLHYYFSASYLNDQGVIKKSGFDRLSTRLNVDYQLKPWLKLGANLSYSNVESRYPGEQTATNSSGNAFRMAYRMGPVYPMFVRDANGNIMIDPRTNKKVYDYGDGQSTPYTRNTMSISNPTGDLTYNFTKYLMDIFDSKWYATITPVKGLDLTYRLGVRTDNTRYRDYGNPWYGQSASYGGNAYQSFSRGATLTHQILANYTLDFADVHHVDAVAGYEYYKSTSEGVEASGDNLYDPRAWVVNNAIDNRRGYGSYTEYKLQGYFMRANYNYDEKYFASASIRRDGSSRFHPDHQWGTFWSVSAAWEIAKENFMQDQAWINMLKLRASFGQNGNDNLALSYFPYYIDWFRATGSDGVFSDGTLLQKGNKDLTWETSNNFNVGVDFMFWNGLLGGSIEYYSRQTTDMLYNKSVARSNGYSSIPVNFGALRNTGLEIELNSKFVDTKDVTASAYVNATFAKRKIIDLIEENGEYKSGTTWWKEGETPDRLNIVRYAGVDKNTGKALYWAAQTDEDGKAIPGTEYATDDYLTAQSTNRVVTGDLTPDVFGGFGFNVEAYGFDFQMGFSYQLGGKMYDYTYAALMHAGRASELGGAWHKDILKAWTPENPNTNVPRLNTSDTDANQMSDRFLVSSNYLSINNIMLGYNLPTNLVKKIGLSGVRVYGAADNVALFCARKGADPRQGRYSTDGSAVYTPIRSVTFGVKVSF